LINILNFKSSSFSTVFEHEQFKLAQMHFHWGHSEHLINGKLYAAELHLVHTSYMNPSKYAVLGFMIQVESV
jgi:carbonic anhydrase